MTCARLAPCGEPLPAAPQKLRQRFPDAAILNTYGPTEAHVATTWIEITDGKLAQHDPLPVGHAKDCELLVTTARSASSATMSCAAI